MTSTTLEAPNTVKTNTLRPVNMPAIESAGEHNVGGLKLRLSRSAKFIRFTGEIDSDGGCRVAFFTEDELGFPHVIAVTELPAKGFWLSDAISIYSLRGSRRLRAELITPSAAPCTFTCFVEQRAIQGRTA